MSRNNKLASGLVLTALMFGASAVARSGAAKTWTLVSERPPPEDQSNRQIDLKDAVAWAVLSGAAVGLARLLVRRGIVYEGSPTDS